MKPVEDYQESQRVATLAGYGILDTEPEPAFDRLTRLAADIFKVPFAAISLIDNRRKWFKSAVGTDRVQVDRDTAISQIIENKGEPFFVEDATQNPETARSPLVCEHPHLRFYAAVPLIAPDGMILGSFSIGDSKKRGQLDPDEWARLRNFGSIAINELELRREILQREQTQQEIAQARLDLELALTLSKTASWQLDIASGQLEWGGAYLDVWGNDVDHAVMTLDAAMNRIHPDDRQSVQDAIEIAQSDDGRGYEVDFRIVLPSGEIRWLAGRGNWVQLRDRETLTGINFDITDNVRQQEEKQLLTRELHHRLRNLFSTLQSIMALTKKSATSIDDYVDRIEGRLRALNRAQQILLDTNFMTGSLAALVKDLAESYPGVSWEGKDITLPENAMVSLSLILHELATNAAKYGALVQPGGTVKIHWSCEDGQINFVWNEEGEDIPEAVPDRAGFGSSLIDHSIKRNLRGEIRREWDKPGLRCALSFPVPNSTDQ